MLPKTDCNREVQSVFFWSQGYCKEVPLTETLQGRLADLWEPSAARLSAPLNLVNVADQDPLLKGLKMAEREVNEFRSRV